MARKYAPIWEQLKAHGRATIATPVPFHRRIIRAVIKEKNLDLGYKVLMAEESKSPRLEYESHGSRLQFRLIINRILESL